MRCVRNLCLVGTSRLVAVRRTVTARVAAGGTGEPFVQFTRNVARLSRADSVARCPYPHRSMMPAAVPATTSAAIKPASVTAGMSAAGIESPMVICAVMSTTASVAVMMTVLMSRLGGM